MLLLVEELVEAAYYSGVLDPKHTRSKHFKALESLSRKMALCASNREDNITLQTHLVSGLLAWGNYMSPIWTNFLGALVGSLQIKDKRVHMKLHRVLLSL